MDIITLSSSPNCDRSHDEKEYDVEQSDPTAVAIATRSTMRAFPPGGLAPAPLGGHSIPVLASTEDDDNDERNRKSKSDYICYAGGGASEHRKTSLWLKNPFLVAIFIVSLVIVAVVTPIAVSRKRSSAADNAKGHNGDSSTMTASYQRERLVEFRALLSRLSDPGVFVNPNSPQSQALRWLVYQDETIPTLPSELNHSDGSGNSTEDLSSNKKGSMRSEQNQEEETDSSFIARRLRQRYALMTLASATGGSEWRGMSANAWKSMTYEDECKWEGVLCTDEGDVSSLLLYYRQMSGRIPQELSLLTSLTSLDFSGNSLEGHLPRSFFEKLTNLEHLSLAFNELSFSLTSSIGLLSRLETLRLNHNDLSGTLPGTFSKLSTLKDIDLSYNDRLHGPFLVHLANWTRLEQLVVSKTGLSGMLPELSKFTNLVDIRIWYSNIQGSLPTDIGLLTDLDTLFLGGPMVTGTIPDEIGHLSNVELLTIRPAMNVTGTLPSTLGQLTELRSLSIGTTGIGGSIPTEIGYLINVIELSLDDNKIEGFFPTQLVDMEALTRLQIYANSGIAGTIPNDMCKPGLILEYDCSPQITCDCCLETFCHGGY